jgi:hypothetical protein
MLRGGSALSALALVGCGLAVSAITAAPAFAQDVTAGQLQGTVLDPEGNPVAGAAVTVESGSGVTRTVTTGSSGSFVIPQLTPGLYQVRIAVEGQPAVMNKDVQVSLGGSNYTFQTAAAGAETQTDEGGDIVVTGIRRATVDFSGTATGQVFDVQQVSERVPVARNIEAIQLLAPQTTPGDTMFGSTGMTANGNTVSIAGSSIAENIYYINGMNVTNFRTFVGGSTVPFEFYDQVQVKTGGYQAEFGRNTGGAVIALSRSGSNVMRGGINAYWNPRQLYSTSPNTFEVANRLAERETYEGNIWASGPIIKDRLFFFAFFNPRYHRRQDTARQCDANAQNCTLSLTETSVIKEPFYGGKIDLNLFDGHRVEATYFNDSQDERLDQSNGDYSKLFSGGENYIFRYTGSFTDWLTVSALYGKSKFNQTATGSAALAPAVLDSRGGSDVQISGPSSLTVDVGSDSRENFRADADLVFDLMGSHHVRIGADREKLTAANATSYSGGVYYRYFRAGAGGARGGAVPPNTDYVRVRTINSTGAFQVENQAFYIQDSWDPSDRLNLSVGVRNDRFTNFNAAGDTFINIENQWSPRLGFNFDPTGNMRSRISGFYGRYYLPVAANTNLRLAGGEEFFQDFHTLTGLDAGGHFNGDLLHPTLGPRLSHEVLSDGEIAPASTLVSKNLKPQFMDEFILGAEHRFGRWTAGLNLTYRRLGAVLEDTDLDGSGDYFSAIEAFCATQTLSFCNKTTVPSIGSSGYVLVNPGADIIVDVSDDAGNLHELTIPNSFYGLPKSKRTSYAAEFRFDRAFDGVWALAGSYVWMRSKGNYEGGVKSDNGQSDTGLTQDFDQLGWTDYSYGYLPNHRTHTFKLYGTYQMFPSFRVGFNALLQSPRKFGCYGAYPYSSDGQGAGDTFTPDERGQSSISSSWYCRTQVTAGNAPQLEGGRQWAVGRGNAFEGGWNKRIDLSFAYTAPIAGLKDFTLRADVFNVFNFHSKLKYDEAGDLSDPLVINPNYRRVTGYQSPRYVRLSASLNF